MESKIVYKCQTCGNIQWDTSEREDAGFKCANFDDGDHDENSEMWELEIKTRDEANQVLAQSEFDKSEYGVLLQILLEGCKGFENMDEEDIVYHYESDRGVSLALVPGACVKCPAVNERLYSKSKGGICPAIVSQPCKCPDNEL